MDSNNPPSNTSNNNNNSAEAELESFRQKWREEVSARSRGKAPVAAATAASSSSSSSKSHAPKSNAPGPTTHSHARHRSLELVDEVEPHTYHDLGEKQHGRRLDETSAQAATAAAASREPKSALEHYERAVEKEAQGSLGDSVNLYRKAFRLDPKVHETYKAKHFPPSSFKPKPQAGPIPSSSSSSSSSSSTTGTAPPQPVPSTPSDPNPSNASVTVPNTAHHSLQGLPPTLQTLLGDFSSLSIQGEPPPTELSPSPPCPISTIPEEILADILVYLAIQDVASFARLSQVCKRLAFLVATEDRVWKRIALGHEYGFAAMHYTWACRIDGKPLGDDDQGGYLLGSTTTTNSPDSNLSSDTDEPSEEPASPLALTPLLVPTIYPTYRTLFHRRPRIRFNGCYISTVNYIRAGASAPTSMAWGSPVHIVTYYRYLRFLRNGTCISLLTTSEPSDVVPYLHIEHMHKNHGALPSAPMKDAVLGRWRLSGPELPSQKGEADADGEKEGTLFIETAGATPKYMYKMVLSLSSAGRGARNNKLGWQGYWSYNRLTDDWGEFTLKNDRAFFWSRVKSYGMGLEEGEE